jgi:hypothetical protein
VAEPVRPALGDLVLPLVQRVVTDETQVLVDHRVPGLDATLVQELNRGATRVVVHGVFAGAEAGHGLQQLRALFQAGDPLPFVADVMTATAVRQVLIADLRVGEVAGQPEMFWYEATLREYIEPPPAEAAVDQVGEDARAEAQAAADQQVAGVADQLGAIEVRVDLGDGDDYAGIAVAVEGTDVDGQPFSLVIEDQVDGVYSAQGVRAATYTVRAVPR